jgi:hypothetical protein
VSKKKRIVVSKKMNRCFKKNESLFQQKKINCFNKKKKLSLPVDALEQGGKGRGTRQKNDAVPGAKFQQSAVFFLLFPFDGALHKQCWNNQQ